MSYIMARNYEKRYTGLNRFLEAKQREQQSEENKPRPSLSKLYSAEDVKKWIPSIQREISYLLMQIEKPHESRNYTDSKIKEFQERVELLKAEHKSFVSKVQQLDPSYKGTVPWQNRAYTRKRSHDQSYDKDSKSYNTSKKLCSALLNREAGERQDKMAAELAERAVMRPHLLVSYSDSDSSTDER